MYAPLLEYDYSFLPKSFFSDELIPLDKDGKVCYHKDCNNEAVFYNATAQGYTCGEHEQEEV